MTLLNASQLRAIFLKKHSDESLEYLADSFNDLFPVYDINTKQRQAAFISQCAHESTEFTRLSENLNYSGAKLLELFSSRVTPEIAAAISHNPEKIGNYIYANRLGNGDVKSGDGYRYRAGGAIGLTGKDNYKKVGGIMGLDLVAHPELLHEPYNAIHAACVFWDENSINEIADTGDVMKVTRKVNGGINGLKERQLYFSRAMAAL